jgi:hypothetical protein
MIEAYKIGVSLILDTTIPGAVGRVISEFEKLNGTVKNIQEGIKGLAGNIRSVAAAAGNLNAATAKFGGVGSGMASDSAKTADNFERAFKAANAIIPAPRLLGYDGGSDGGGAPSVLRLAGPSGGASGAFDGYAGGGGGGGGLAAVAAGGSGMGLGGVGGAMAGLYTIEIGVGMVERFFGLLNTLLDKATALNAELTKLHMAGVDPDQIKAIDDAAHVVVGLVPGREYAEIVTDVRHMRATLGEEPTGDPFEQIKKYLPQVEQAAAVLHFTTCEDTGVAMGNLLRAMELRGDVVDPKMHQISPERFSGGLEAATRVSQQSPTLAL